MASIPNGAVSGMVIDPRKLGSIFSPQRKLKVICAGAGASGLFLAYKMQRHFDNFDLEVFEKNPEVSGTWYENRYPGCACDIPAHCYTYSFEPKTDWSANYARAGEILTYFKDFATKYQLGRFIKLQHEVLGAVWNDKTSQWTIKVKNHKTNEIIESTCHVFINAGGVLNKWRYPAIPGINGFKGELAHSAAWPEKLDLTGKVVGLIGNGSSGVQILPNIKDQCKSVVTFIREATWVSPPFGAEFKAFSKEEQEEFARNKEYHLAERRRIEEGMNGSFAMFLADSPQQHEVRKHMEGMMRGKIHSEKLQGELIPEWSVGCRRITPGTGYLEALEADNVEVVFGNITSITENGVICDDGSGEHQVDVLVCATGFDTTFKPRFPLLGTGGKDLAELWKDEPRGYLGVAATGFPNYFFILGPNTPVGNGPLIPAIEANVQYIISVLSKFQKENLVSFDIKPEVVDEINNWKDGFMKETIWSEECRSWYKAGSASGKILALWPGSTLHYLETIRDVRWEDWNIKYQPNQPRFSYLGNGHSSAEAITRNLSYYIKNADDSFVDPILKRPTEVVESQGTNNETVKVNALPERLSHL